jgi:hypothetical protein
MLFKVNGEYLDFNDDVEIERQAKVFEYIDETAGDFSYSFAIPKTTNNLRIFGNPFPDVSSKIIYSELSCEISDDDGVTLYTGKLRVEKINNNIECSFFSGNYNWISELTGNMTDLRLSDYDKEQTYANINASWNATSGIMYPWLDLGALDGRSNPDLKIEDFVGCFFLKTLFQEIFTQIGIKLRGDLLNDWRFNNLLVVTNTRSKTDAENNSAYLGKTSTQVFTPTSSGTITFNNTSSPYFVGDDLSWNGTDELTIPYKMVADIDLFVEMSGDAVTTVYPIMINGTTVAAGSGFPNAKASIKNVSIEAGDIITSEIFNGGATDINIDYATLRVIPKFIYYTFGKSCVPLWTKREFVSSVLNIFNAVTDYNPKTKELTIDFFDRIKTKPSIDISKYIKIDEIDYSEFISSFGRKNNFSFAKNNDESLKEYNISSFVKYAAGVIDVDNAFINESVNVIDSPFSSPVSYYNNTFQQGIERLAYVQLEENGDKDFTTVTNSGGTARFAVSGANDIFQSGDLVRITESTESSYNGEWIVTLATSAVMEVNDLLYSGSATGKIELIKHTLTTDDSVFLILTTGAKTITDFSNLSEFYLEGFTETIINFSYFNLIQLGFDIEDDYTQGMSFGGEETDAFQASLIQDYWRNFENILGDPVKPYCTAFFPRSVYLSLTPLQPVYIKHEKTSNLYYINRITGYKSSDKPCYLELIKL